MIATLTGGTPVDLRAAINPPVLLPEERPMDLKIEHMHCPFCPSVDRVSDEDPDASFSEMLGHIRSRHYDEDQTPAVLWPKIEIKAGE